MGGSFYLKKILQYQFSRNLFKISIFTVISGWNRIYLEITHFSIWPPSAILNLRKNTRVSQVHPADYDSGGSVLPKNTKNGLPPNFCHYLLSATGLLGCSGLHTFGLKPSVE